MRIATIAKVSTGMAGWLMFLFFAGLIVRNSLGYFGSLNAMEFVEVKTPASELPLWRVMLVTHVAAGMVCFAASVLQFFRGISRRWPALHRSLGKTYVWSVLWLLCPTGAYLALYADGGFAGQSGFLVLGALTFWTTWRGVFEMQQGRPRAHVRWMIRSFALVTAAITFRIYHLALGYTTLSPEANYIAALWLSIAGNALVGEALARLVPLTVPRPKTNMYHETDIHAPLLSRAGSS
jgi:uncharacterized membrane protein